MMIRKLIENRNNFISKNMREMILVIIIILLGLFFHIATPIFGTVQNFTNMSNQTIMLLFMSMGMTYALIAGELDISVAALGSFSGMMCAWFLNLSHGNIPLSILAVLSIGLSVALINGLLTLKGNIPSFLVTLGMMVALRALEMKINQQRPIMISSDDFRLLFSAGYLGPIPVPIIYIGISFIVLYLILAKTRYGRYVYAVGSNEEACRESGINTFRIKLSVFIICSLLSTFAGILLSSRLMSGVQYSLRQGEFKAIIAALLGGCILQGGRGSLQGTVLGVTLLAILGNGLTHLGIDLQIQNIIQALLLLIILFVDNLIRSRQKV